MLKINTHYDQRITSQMLNEKIQFLIGENKVFNGFDVIPSLTDVTITTGMCNIQGAFISEDSVVEVIPVDFSKQRDKVHCLYIEYNHYNRSVYYHHVAVDKDYTPADNELILARIKVTVAQGGELDFIVDTPEKAPTLGNASGLVEVTCEKPMPVDIFGLKAGTTFNKARIEDVLLRLLYPYTLPVIGLSSGISTGLREKGVEISNIPFTISVTEKTDDVIRVALRNGSRVIREWSGSQIPTSNPFTLQCNDIETISDTTTYTVDIVDGTQTNSKTLTFPFELPVLVGVTATEGAPDPSKLTKKIVNKGNISHPYTTNHERFVIMYPASWGVLRSIKDPNNFEIFGTFTQGVTNVTTLVGDVSYRYYVGNLTTVSNFNVTYIF